jgi:serine/threonine-protein kinase
MDDETPPQAGPPTAPENATADRTLSVSELDVTRPDLPSAALQPTSARFTLLEPLAHGGMGEVWRARDTRLGREVALKTLLPALAENAEAFLRLRTEAELTAQLRHPGVLCVIDAGTFADGRFWYTMPIVEGRTFGAEITEGHRQTHAGERPASSVLHHLMTHFLVICQVMAHAHERGIIHRDLKPANVMVGRFGEVFVMDWGLAKALDAAEVGQNGGAEGIALVSPKTETHYGAIMGTPAYMPPEQAAGRLEAVDRRSDVYALGAVLWHVLAGGPPGRIGHAPADSPLHPEPALWDIATGAMASEPAARPADAGALARAVESWLDGALRRTAALSHLATARSHASDQAARRERASALRQGAQAGLERLGPRATDAEKRPYWQLEDMAGALERRLRVDTVEIEQALRQALALAPDLAQAREMLADGYRDRLVAAEQLADAPAAAEAEALLRAAGSAAHTAWLDAGARLTLTTSPAGAQVSSAPLTLVDRRLEAGEARPLGNTPLVGAPLPRGRHLVTVTAPGCAPLRLPLLAERQGELSWGAEAAPLELLPADALGPDDVLVPGGPFIYGGDPHTAEPLPRRVVEVPPFVVRRHPVTLAEIIEWLDALTAEGRADVADAHAPRLPPLVVGDNPTTPLPKDREGRRRLPAHLAHLGRYPALDLTWLAAMDFADWVAARTGRPWRLLHEVEREKAARASDARLFPWGDFAEPTWFRSAVSHPAGPLPVSVDACPKDRSAYGVFGLAGNVRDWCLNVWETDGGPFDDDRLVITRPAADDGRYRAVRGGAWNASPHLGRAAERFVGWPGHRYPTTGLRLCWSVGTAGLSAAACPRTSP